LAERQFSKVLALRLQRTFGSLARKQLRGSQQTEEEERRKKVFLFRKGKRE